MMHVVMMAFRDNLLLAGASVTLQQTGSIYTS